MLLRRKSGLASWVVILVAMSVVLTDGCRNRVPPGEGDSNVEPAGEPEQYSATVVRIVEDGTSRETSVSREARSGEKRREEWTEEGQNRALIWRPDLGKSFLLDLDGRAYVELEITSGHLPESPSGASNPHDVSSARNAGGPDVGDSTVQALDHDFGNTQPPTRVETRVLAPAVIDGHSCAVYEQRAIFRDRHVETTRRFRARDLSGLVLRVESEAEQGSARVITERRDVRIDVAPDTFNVPADFKKVEGLPGAQSSSLRGVLRRKENSPLAGRIRER